jgi:replicative superfamily II helicase
VFAGLDSLNVIQSKVFDRAYESLDNLLICAPTGAGKTNIALLAALRTIRDNCSANGKINKAAFKASARTPSMVDIYLKQYFSSKFIYN